jgi:hypothetical protein
VIAGGRVGEIEQYKVLVGEYLPFYEKTHSGMGANNSSYSLS